MLKWNCKTRSKEALKINSLPSLLWPETLHLLRWWYIICFLSETRACLPWLMPAHSRTSPLYTHAAFELWKGRGMKSRLSRKVLLKSSGDLWLLLMLLQLLLCNTTEGACISGMATSKGVVRSDDYDAGSYIHTCSKPQVVWFVVDSNLSMHSMSVRKEQLVRKLLSQ